MDILDLKNIIFKIKNQLEVFNSKLDRVKDRIVDLKIG